jgi:aminoglycoside phosphotransferase family enzyme/predicted kinase
MPATDSSRIESDRLVELLSDPKAYPQIDADKVTVRETHISWVFLVGDFAFKIKKPVKTDFLDYSTLEKRECYCHEEVRLDRRYAQDLYLGVAPICMTGNGVQVDADRAPVEFAVKMRRFPDDALLSEQVEHGLLGTEDIAELASTIADFHRRAARAELCQTWGSPPAILHDANDNLRYLADSMTGETAKTLCVLERWTAEFYQQHQPEFAQRIANGFIRECHGDLHLANVVRWDGRWMPFDGIEFNDAFRWIDVLSDAAFTAMDFAARGHLELCRSFVSRYLESTGDHASPSLLRWYLVYRALTRAKVAAIRAGQMVEESEYQIEDAIAHVDLAFRFSLRQDPCLWITHGVSGSGKTTSSEVVVQQAGAIRLRSDVERKRHFGLLPTDRLTKKMQQQVYCESANHATYTRLRRIATGILRAGFPVVVDATFLKQSERTLFHNLAKDEGASFAILNCDTDELTLRRRITDRIARNTDASDADISVMEKQLKSREPLTESEISYVVDIPDPVQTVNQL